MTNMTEQQMRESEVPAPKTADELSEYIAGLVEREHDYGTCVYALSMAAVAAFNHVASKLGVTGFQASCADMDIIRRIRSMRGPFMLIDGANALYPQYDLRGNLNEFLKEIQPWLAEQADSELRHNAKHAHQSVIAHWKKLAALAKDST